MKLLGSRGQKFNMQWLAGREGRRDTGALMPATEYGLRDGVDNIGELSIRLSG